MYDCGQSLNPAVDLGQIEGAFVQGIGFFMNEEYLTNSDGLVISDSTWTYKIPTIDTIPNQLNVQIINSGPHKKRVLSSKGTNDHKSDMGLRLHLNFHIIFPSFWTHKHASFQVSFAKSHLHHHRSCRNFKSRALSINPYYHLTNSGTCNYEHLSHFFTEYPVAPGLPSELLPPPETYQGGGCAATLSPCYEFGRGNGVDQVEERCNIHVKKQNVGNGRGSLSAQSMAARVRRRKISEKTQELGKLIPGGHKMNTAEMFQSAFKYIKFLQTQIGVLKLMALLPETDEVLSNGEMQDLVTCRSASGLYT